MPWVRNYDVRSLAIITRATATVEGNDVDLQGLINPGGREMKAILNAVSIGSDSDETLIVTIEESDDTVAANFATVATFPTHLQTTASAQLELHFVAGAGKRFLRAIATLAGTTPAFDYSVDVIGELRMA